MWKALRRAGERVPRCRVQRLMRSNGIVGAKRRGKPWRTTRPDPQAGRRPDLVQRHFNATSPNRLWVADDPRLAELVGDLSIKDPQFRQWWAGTHVALKRRGTRTYDHPVVGEITLDWDALTSDAEPDQQVIIYTAEPGSPSEQALRNLAVWAAERFAPARSSTK
jgi:hypothetical protein